PGATCPPTIRSISTRIFSTWSRAIGSSNHPLTGAASSSAVEGRFALTSCEWITTLISEGIVLDSPRSNGRIRVLTGDAQPLFREAITRALRQRSQFDVISEVSDGADALDAIRRLRPDVAVLDLPLPSLDGRRILNAVERDGLPTRIVLLLRSVPSEVAF